jgi:DNA-binding protein H-NS
VSKVKSSSNNIKWTHKATGDVEWIVNERLPRTHYMNIECPMEHVNSANELVVYSDAEYQRMTEAHATKMERLAQTRIKQAEEKAAKTQIAKAILSNQLVKKRKAPDPKSAAKHAARPAAAPAYP